MSEVRELVEGVPMSPFVHVATGADFPAPSPSGDQGSATSTATSRSICTVFRHTMVGFDVVNHHATDGIAIGECCCTTSRARSGRPRWRARAAQADDHNVPPP